MRTLLVFRLLPSPCAVSTALGIAAAAACLPAQAVVYASRNGSNVVSCGPLGGPGVVHAFSTTTAVNDTLAVTDPGGTTGGGTWGASAANAQFTGSATATTFSLTVAGDISRGMFGGVPVWTLADGRDSWVITVAAPTRFTLSASLSTASTEATVPPSHFTFGGLGLVPDPGAPPPPYQQTLTVPGSVAITASGTLMPGTYVASLFGRADGTAYPLSCSYSNSLVVTFQPAPLAAATPRQAPGNPDSYTCSLPVLGQPWSAHVDVGSTGHGFALVFASPSPANLPIAPGFTVLISPPVQEFLPVVAGPVAHYVFGMPASPTLAGFQLSTQALHFGLAPTLLLSNAQDLTLGF